MKGFRFRLRTLVLVVALIATLFSCVAMWRRHNSRRTLRANDGPYLVLAHIFHGKGAERDALALAEELETKHGLSARVYHVKRRGVSPTTKGPQKGSTVAVLVGDAKSVKHAKQTLQRVKQIAPKSLAGVATGPKDLRRAVLTANPLTAISPYRPFRQYASK